MLERRRAVRFRTRFETLYSGKHDGQGAGRLVNISYSGLRLEDTEIQPEVGTKLEIHVFIQPVAPFSLTGHVVRHTSGGFAVDYDLFDPEIRRLVDDVAAIVNDA